MTRYTGTEFSTNTATARLFNPGTMKAAIATAKVWDITIRREPPDGYTPASLRGIEVYPAGFPQAAIYADCPREALFLALALASDTDNARLTSTGHPTIRGMAETIAKAASELNDLEPGTIRAKVTPTSGYIHVVFYCPSQAGISHKATIATGAMRPTGQNVAVALAEAAVAVADDLDSLMSDAPDNDSGGDSGATHTEIKAAVNRPRNPCPPIDCMGLPTAVTTPEPAPACEACGGTVDVQDFDNGGHWAEVESLCAHCRAKAPAPGTTDPAPKRPHARRKTDLTAMAARSDLLGELARDGLRAVASGGFPLYAFRDNRPLSEDDLDSLIYDSCA